MQNPQKIHLNTSISYRETFPFSLVTEIHCEGQTVKHTPQPTHLAFPSGFLARACLPLTPGAIFRLSFGYWMVTAWENSLFKVRARPCKISIKRNLFRISLTVSLAVTLISFHLITRIFTRPVTVKFTSAIGMKIFHPIVINWSYLYLGRVALIQ